MLWIAEAVQAWVRQALRRRAAPVVCADASADTIADTPAEAPAIGVLPLGGDDSGATYVLNLETGAIECVAPLPPVHDPDSAPLHSLSQVTPALLATVCERGGYLTRLDALGDITVFTGIGDVLLVTLGEKADLVMLGRKFTFAESASPRDRATLVRRLNRLSVMVRFDAGSGAWFVAQYPFLITAGLSPAQLLATLRVFVDQTRMHLDACKADRFLA
jgi:hypothetical protein